MAEKNSKALKAELNDVVKSIKENKLQVETMTAELQLEPWGSSHYFDLEEGIKQRQKELPLLIAEKKELQKHLMLALANDLETLRPIRQQAATVMADKAQKIIDELMLAVRKAEEALKKAAEPFNPTDLPVDIAISLEIRNTPVDRAPVDNAINLMAGPLEAFQSMKTHELVALKELLKNER